MSSGDRPRKLYAERALNLPLGAELITGNMWYWCQIFVALTHSTFLRLPQQVSQAWFPLVLIFLQSAYSMMSAPPIITVCLLYVCVFLQWPAFNVFKLWVSRCLGRRSGWLPFSASHYPCTQAPAAKDTPWDLPGICTYYLFLIFCIPIKNQANTKTD